MSRALRAERALAALLAVAALVHAPACCAQGPGRGAVVAAPEDFKDALEKAPLARHIVVEAHLDFTDYPSSETSVFVLSAALQSVQGNCASSLATPSVARVQELLPLLPFQCVLLHSKTLLEVSPKSALPGRTEIAIWLSNLYLRLNRAVAPSTLVVPLLATAGNLYLEGVTIQNDVHNNSMALAQALGSYMHFQSSTIADFRQTGLPAVMSVGASTAFDNCTFKSIINELAAILLFGRASSLRVANSAFDTVSPYAVWANDSATVAYVDATAAELVAPGMQVQPATAAPAGLFVGQQDPGLAAIKQDAPQLATARASAADAPPPGPGGEVPQPVRVGDAPPAGRSNWGTFIGSMVGVFLALLLIGALVAWLLLRRRRPADSPGEQKFQMVPVAGTPQQHGQQVHIPPPGMHAYAPPRYAPPPGYGHGSWQGPGGGSVPSGAGMQVASVTSGSWQSQMHTQSTFAPTGYYVNTLTTEVREGVEGLEDALDDMERSNTLFMGRYVIQGAVGRRVGGQGLVQFVTQLQPVREYAIKFFLRRDAFEAERTLYDRSELRRMMPATKEVVSNDDGSLRAANGYVFPPCIVIQKGQSLEEFSRTLERDGDGFLSNLAQLTMLQAIIFVADRLRQLHDAGFVHRDIKPGNVLRLPDEHAWTLIDFGCAAPTGRVAPLAWSPMYAAPEVVLAYEQKATSMPVQPSLDVYSLGVVAYEALTGLPPMPHGIPFPEVCDRIVGRRPMRWEEPDAQQAIKRLGRLGRTVLACLERTPEKRPTAASVIDSWNHMFSSLTATQASDGAA